MILPSERVAIPQSCDAVGLKNDRAAVRSEREGVLEEEETCGCWETTDAGTEGAEVGLVVAEALGSEDADFLIIGTWTAARNFWMMWVRLVVCVDHGKPFGWLFSGVRLVCFIVSVTRPPSKAPSKARSFQSQQA